MPLIYVPSYISIYQTFQAMDMLALSPVCMHVVCTSVDGRQLLEASKAALDAALLDEAVRCGVKALAALATVCGPRNRLKLIKTY
jgi:protein TIF31